MWAAARAWTSKRRPAISPALHPTVIASDGKGYREIVQQLVGDDDPVEAFGKIVDRRVHVIRVEETSQGLARDRRGFDGVERVAPLPAFGGTPPKEGRNEAAPLGARFLPSRGRWTAGGAGRTEGAGGTPSRAPLRAFGGTPPKGGRDTQLLQQRPQQRARACPYVDDEVRTIDD